MNINDQNRPYRRCRFIVHIADDEFFLSTSVKAVGPWYHLPQSGWQRLPALKGKIHYRPGERIDGPLADKSAMRAYMRRLRGMTDLGC